MTPWRGTWLRLAGGAALGLAVVALVAAFFLLYLRVPPGHSPITGLAPRIGAVFLAVFPYPSVALGPEAFRRAAVGLVLGMWAAYGGAAFWTTRLRDPAERRRALQVIAAVTVAGHLLLVLLPPVLSTDLYRYGLFGKMILAGDNPYLTPASALAGDALWPYAGWRHLRSHYGPTFLWVSAGATALGGGGPIGTALAFKAVVAAFNLLACWTVRELARCRDGDDGLTALSLYALNPLVLMEGPGQAHTEPVMASLALLGVLLWWRGRPATGFALLIASAAVNFVTSVLLLLAAVKMLAEATGQRLRVAGRLLGASLLVGIGLFGPFWRGGAVFGQASELIIKGSAIDISKGPAPDATPVVALAIFAVGLAAAAVLAVRLARPHLLEVSAVLVSFFLLAVLWIRMPWYFITAMALTIPGGPTRSHPPLRLSALLLGLLGMLLYCTLVPTGRP